MSEISSLMNEDDKPHPKVFYGSREPRGEVDHVDKVLDHSLFVAGTDILFEDWKSLTPEKRKERLEIEIEKEKEKYLIQSGIFC